MTTRVQVVAEARSWLRTEYHHHARVKGVGVDCAQLLLEVFHACGMVERLNVGEYSTQWHLHRNEEIYLGWLERYARPTVTPLDGDVGIWKFGRTYSHAGIVVGGDVIHALRSSRCVTITGMRDQPLGGRPVRFFTLFEG